MKVTHIAEPLTEEHIQALLAHGGNPEGATSWNRVDRRRHPWRLQSRPLRRPWWCADHGYRKAYFKGQISVLRKRRMRRHPVAERCGCSCVSQPYGAARYQGASIYCLSRV